MIKLKGIYIIVLISIIILTNGCWDRNDPEDLAIVTALGIDYNPERKLFKLSMQLANAVTIGQQAGGGGGGEKPKYWVVSAWGYTPFDALSNLTKKVSRKIHYSHIHVQVISERMAKSTGMLPLLEATDRTRQTRLITFYAITKGDVDRLLAEEFVIEEISGTGLYKLLRLPYEQMGGTIMENARIFLNKLSKPGIEPVAVYLELNKEQGSQLKQLTPAPVTLKGIAAFKNDKMIGILDTRETRGYNWIVNNIKAANLTFRLQEGKEKYVTARTIRASSKFEPVLENGEPKIDIKIRAECEIVNLTGVYRFKTESELTRTLKNRISEVIRNDVELALDKAKSLESDIFGFGNAFFRLKYDEWEKMKDDWPKIFSKMPVDISVEVLIKRSGMINKTIKPQH